VVVGDAIGDQLEILQGGPVPIAVSMKASREHIVSGAMSSPSPPSL
jgi:hypothetical protein